MPITESVATGTCDCCGEVFDPNDLRSFVRMQRMGVVLCTANKCGDKIPQGLMDKSFKALKTAHAALPAAAAGRRPEHPN